MLHNSELVVREDWTNWIHQLLDLGFDLHSPSGLLSRRPVLDHIMDIADSSFESMEIGEEWLDTLEGYGFDVGDYIQTEYLQHHKGSRGLPIWHMGQGWLDDRIDDDDNRGFRSRVTIFSENTPSRVSWDWYIDPKSHAFEVLYEFRHLGPSYHNFCHRSNLPGAAINWPFSYPCWRTHRVSLNWGRYVGDKMRSIQTFLKNFENRFERRWLKKIQKLERAQGFGKRPKVPGGWID